MFDKKYLNESTCFEPPCVSLQSAAIQARERAEIRQEEMHERYEKGLVDPCKCTWEKPDPQEAYDNETLSMWDARRGGYSRTGQDTYTAEEMRRRP
mgnify:CR=1 FL=1